MNIETVYQSFVNAVCFVLQPEHLLARGGGEYEAPPESALLPDFLVAARTQVDRFLAAMKEAGFTEEEMLEAAPPRNYSEAETLGHHLGLGLLECGGFIGDNWDDPFATAASEYCVTHRWDLYCGDVCESWCGCDYHETCEVCLATKQSLKIPNLHDHVTGESTDA